MNEGKPKEPNELTNEPSVEVAVDKLVDLLAEYEENSAWLKEDIVAIEWELENGRPKNGFASKKDPITRIEKTSSKLRELDRELIHNVFDILETRVMRRQISK